jgi:DNA-binding HxlR family transcriptional regulator
VSEYGQYCPVAKASELFCRRWTPLVVRELLYGSRRFNEIQRGVPLMSPSLLSKRLKELERAEVVTRAHDGGYELTEAGRELYGIVRALGEWGQRWARSDYRAEDLDAGLLLWSMRRFLRPDGLDLDHSVVQFDFPGQPARKRRYWLVASGPDVDVCLVDPGFPVDVVVKADLQALTKIWMGDSTFADELRSNRIELEGPPELVRRIPGWLGQHPILAGVKSARAPEAS